MRSGYLEEMEMSTQAEEVTELSTFEMSFRHAQLDVIAHDLEKYLTSKLDLAMAGIDVEKAIFYQEALQKLETL